MLFIKNIFSLAFERVFRITLAMVSLPIVARQLSPSGFGELSFIFSYTAIFILLAGLGLKNIIIKYLVDKKFQEEEIVSSAFVLIFIASLSFYLIQLFSFSLFFPEKAPIASELALAGFVLLVKATDVFSFRYEAEQKFQKVIIFQIISLTLCFILKILGTVFDSGLKYYVSVYLIESVIFSVLVVGRYAFDYNFSIIFRPRRDLIVIWLRKSFVLVVSAFAIYLNMKFDIIMLAKMTNEYEVGVYAVAARISEAVYMIFGVIISAAIPILVRSSDNDLVAKQDLLQTKWAAMYCVMFWVSVFFASFISIFSSNIVFILFGDHYIGSVSILTVHVWSGVSVAVGGVWSCWLLYRDRMGLSAIVQVFAALCNVSLNFILIPQFGAFGAATATALSYTFTAVLSLFMFESRSVISQFLHGVVVSKSCRSLIFSRLMELTSRA